MAHDPKFIAARARLNALCENLPSFVSEQHVKDYHDILNEIEKSSEYDLSSFSIPQQKLDYPVVGAVRGSYSGRPGRVIHGTKKQCDTQFFTTQVVAAREFLKEMHGQAKSSAPHPRDYWSMPDDTLMTIAQQLHIVPQLRPYAAGPGRSPTVDREKIIRQLVQRDQVLLASPDSFVSVNIHGDVHGSTIQTASPLASAATSSSFNAEAVSEIISKLKNEKTKLDIPDSSRNQYDSDIETIESEIHASEPRHSVIKARLRDLMTILLNVGGGVVANAIWQEIAHYLASHP
jgi:hypothetical protein